MDTDDNNNEFDIPLNRPLHLINPNNFNRCLAYSGFSMLFLSTSLLIILTILISPVTREVSETLEDSHTTISDLQTILPEIKESLQILKDFCHIPDFQKYCYPHTQNNL